MENTSANSNFQELLVNLLSKLKDREQDVLKQRYHLTSDLDKKATLRQIGEVYNITRERVRQIEKEAIRKLTVLAKTKEFAEELKTIENLLINHLERNGGLIREDHLLENFVKENYALDFFHDNAYLFVLEHLFNAVEKVDNHDAFYRVWKLTGTDIEKIAELIGQLASDLNDQNKLHGRESILNLAKENLSAELKLTLKNYTEKHEDVELDHLLESYLQATNKVEKNIMNEWGLTEWHNVKPSKLSDKILLVFQKENKPLHFRDIAEKINLSDFAGRKIAAPTVHNELIANGNFVLVGRGLYALKNWGYTAGTVADVIEKILRKNGGPLSKDAINNQVLKQRQVNPSTIYLALIGNNKFEKLADGKFNLK